MDVSNPLPLGVNNAEFANADEYVESLLDFITSNDLFQTLCGGVHILDFLTKEPDLYSSILPQEWRDWFKTQDLNEILDLLTSSSSAKSDTEQGKYVPSPSNGSQQPPENFINYIRLIRKHSLDRKFPSTNIKACLKGSSDKSRTLPRHIAVGMKTKKIHEVQNFAEYVNELVMNVNESTNHVISDIVDFGSGQNYLGRALASPPYCKSVVALESKSLNIAGAKSMDVVARLADKKLILRDKKRYRRGLEEVVRDPDEQISTNGSSIVDSKFQESERDRQSLVADGLSTGRSGSIRYIETVIENGDLSRVVKQISNSCGKLSDTDTAVPSLMVVSLHSCGNLIHHGLKSLILNESVKAVAMVGCCYNLVTERLGPPTYKLPSLRSAHPRLVETSSASDPHGFPMSERLATYPHRQGHGIRLNITARMMGVQAPDNWTDTECESFFTRHFYRALLQRILLDRGVVGVPSNSDCNETSPRGWTGPGPALTIGSLRKACYASFQAYVRGAIAKLENDPERGPDIAKRMESLTDVEIQRYEDTFKDRKKDLSIVWSLMAFSAIVVESTMVVDRWLYLREQEAVKDCWVQTVFDYKQSPRNLVVVGIKK